jgi:hypothetical protein
MNFRDQFNNTAALKTLKYGAKFVRPAVGLYFRDLFFSFSLSLILSFSLSLSHSDSLIKLNFRDQCYTTAALIRMKCGDKALLDLLWDLDKF